MNDDPVAWVSVCQSVCLSVTRPSSRQTSPRCGRCYITVTICSFCYCRLNESNSTSYKKLGCGCHAARTLVHVVFPRLRPASRDLLATFFDSQAFTRGKLLTAYWLYVPTCYTLLPFDAIRSNYPVHVWYGKTRMAGLRGVAISRSNWVILRYRVRRGLTSHSTLYRSFRGRCQVEV